MRTEDRLRFIYERVLNYRMLTLSSDLSSDAPAAARSVRLALRAAESTAESPRRLAPAFGPRTVVVSARLVALGRRGSLARQYCRMRKTVRRRSCVGHQLSSRQTLVALPNSSGSSLARNREASSRTSTFLPRVRETG